jgi:hypothetical protein
VGGAKKVVLSWDALIPYLSHASRSKFSEPEARIGVSWPRDLLIRCAMCDQSLHLPLTHATKLLEIARRVNQFRICCNLMVKQVASGGRVCLQESCTCWRAVLAGELYLLESCTP